MSYDANFQIRTAYVLVEANCSWTFENAKLLIDAAKAEAVKYGFQKILFNLKKWQNPDSSLTRYLSGEYLAQTFKGQFKVASFGNAEVINKLGENVAVNRGARYRIFSDETEAEKWLLSESAPGPQTNS